MQGTDGLRGCTLRKKDKAQFAAIKAYYSERDKRMLAMLTEADRQALNRILVTILQASGEWE
jgi:hypothetical protein